MENKFNITRVAFMLGITRPTMYRYIALYDSGSYRLIPKKVLSVLKYIDSCTVVNESTYFEIFKRCKNARS